MSDAKKPMVKMTMRRNWARGFTLVEVMTCLCIVALLSAFVLPGLQSAFSGKNIDAARDAISAELAEARSKAVSQNTYVWVGLENPVINNAYYIRVAIVQSIDGTANLSPDNIKQVNQMLSLPNMQLCGRNSTPLVNAALVSLLQSASASATALLDAPTQLNFTCANQTFSGKIITFTPQGQALIQTTSTGLDSLSPYTDQIEINVQPAHGTLVPSQTKDGFGIWVLGGSGQTRVWMLN